MKPLLHEITPEELDAYAWLYIKECLENKKQQATASGNIVELKERQVPTIMYFLRIWLPLKFGKTIARQTWYNWLKREADISTVDTLKKPTSEIIKDIELNFAALAIDILANGEGKGSSLIFYAKNKLGFHDRHEVESSDKNNLPPITITGMEIL
jgi:hypothetical protein